MSARYQRGSLRKEGARWILRRRVDGHEVRIFVGKVSELRNLEAARRAADAKLEQATERGTAGAERITLKRYAKFFLEEVCAQRKPSTRAGYASIFKQHLLPLFGAKPLFDIVGRDFTHLTATLEQGGSSPATILTARCVLARALRSAIAHGYAARSPDLKSLRFGTKRVVRPPRRIFSIDDVKRIIEASEFPWRALYTLLGLAGLRTGEALGLPWRNVDLPEKQLVIDQAAYMGRIQSTKSAGSARPVHISEQLAGMLQLFRDWRRAGRLVELDRREAAIAEGLNVAEPLPPAPDGESLLFFSPKDPEKPLWASGVRRDHFQPLLKRLEIAQAGLHAFRHTYCTHLFKLGIEAPVVQALMRHSDIKTTMSYTHVTLDDQRRGSDSFSKAIQPEVV